MRCRRRDLSVIVAAAGVVMAGARLARGGELRTIEHGVFVAVNELDHRAFVPVWTVMQLGSLGGALTSAGVVAASGRPRLGRRMAVVGTLAWTASKGVKPFVGRGRPVDEIGTARLLGREQNGLGYPSGHAAVAAALAAVVAPQVRRTAQAALWLGALGVGAARVYVGAHLPLDVVGGVALGVGTERLVRTSRLRGRAPRRARGAVSGGAPDENGRRRLLAAG